MICSKVCVRENALQKSDRKDENVSAMSYSQMASLSSLYQINAYSEATQELFSLAKNH